MNGEGLALLGWLQVVEPESVAGVLVELAVQLAAVRASVVLAHETRVPHGVADHTRLLDQDLLLEPVDDLLPTACLDLVVEDDDAVGMRLAPDHDHLAAALVVRVDDRPRLRGLAAAAAHETQLRPEPIRRLALGLVVLGLRLLERAPHPEEVIAEPVVGRQQLRLLLGRADELLERVLERGLEAL